jgi:hypothetical protein
MATEKLIYANAGNVLAEYVKKHLNPGESDFLKGYMAGIEGMANALETVPGIDTAEVVHGRWENHDWKGVKVKGFMACSACNAMIPTADDNYYCLLKLNYCPNCGAKMDGDGNG